jgi:hypothetical protein
MVRIVALWQVFLLVLPFLLPLSIHQYPLLIHSPITNALWHQQSIRQFNNTQDHAFKAIHVRMKFCKKALKKTDVLPLTLTLLLSHSPHVKFSSCPHHRKSPLLQAEPPTQPHL